MYEVLLRSVQAGGGLRASRHLQRNRLSQGVLEDDEGEKRPWRRTRRAEEAHQEFLENLSHPWGRDSPCSVCGMSLGIRYSPVRVKGVWYHYDCATKVLEENGG